MSLFVVCVSLFMLFLYQQIVFIPTQQFCWSKRPAEPGPGERRLLLYPPEGTARSSTVVGNPPFATPVHSACAFLIVENDLSLGL